ncbi:MAG: cyclic pyranopterin monophosphate synthase MoaC [Planctomycetes bacterium]|nr:cyclic pyranopterin monophosphate synthase MoaC [Planctomycetota bacterium]
MVDVGAKPVTSRVAVAEGEVKVSPATLSAVLSGSVPKGDAALVARVAGILAAKRTPELIPLCHPVRLTDIEVAIEPDAARSVLSVVATARAEDRTGVEMEAMTAVAVACLALYDMLKSLEKGIEIGKIRLVRKEGGKSGPWVRDAGS